uniref:Uncharacterized protein n=1 Tax=Anguilla anguilla TaxID=7936 RepID=A0A0E9PF70_ANGAN
MRRTPQSFMFDLGANFPVAVPQILRAEVTGGRVWRCPAHFRTRLPECFQIRA